MTASVLLLTIGDILKKLLSTSSLDFKFNGVMTWALIWSFFFAEL